VLQCVYIKIHNFWKAIVVIVDSLVLLAPGILVP